jgi:hypothetical protein
MVDLKKYETPFERHWELSKLETSRNWILYSIQELKLNTRNELIHELERTFKPKYIPILTEFKFTLGKGYDFEELLDTLVNPLLKNDLLIKRNGDLFITDKGRKRINELTGSLRYHQ